MPDIANIGIMEVPMADTNISKTQEYWCRHLEKWHKSGLSQAEYCRRNDLNPNAFQWQKGRQRKQKASFVPVRVKEKIPRITIGIGDSIRVEILRELGATELASLIRTLGDAR